MLLESYSLTVFLLTKMLPQSLLLLLLVSISSVHSSTTIYDALQSNGLPVGLFPEGITNFTLNQDGTFKIFLPQECNSKFENKIHYDQEISGVLSKGRITSLVGVSASDLFLWFEVKEIRVDVPSQGIIYFDMGVVSKQFPFSLFESHRDCIPGEASESGIIRKELPRKLGNGFEQANYGRAVS